MMGESAVFDRTWAFSVIGLSMLCIGTVAVFANVIPYEPEFSVFRFSTIPMIVAIGLAISGFLMALYHFRKQRHGQIPNCRLITYEGIVLAGAFLIDLEIPQGVAVGLVYVFPIVGAWFFRKRMFMWMVAGICTLLVLINIVLSVEFPYGDAVEPNTFISVAAIWVCVAVVDRLKKLSDDQLETESKFRLAIEGTTAGVWDWCSIEDGRMWCSAQFYELLGYENNESDRGLEELLNLIHPNDRKRSAVLITKHLRNHEPYELELRMRHRVEGYKWFVVSGQAKWDSSGKPVRMVGTIIDVNQRKLAQAAETERSRQLAKKNKELEEFSYVASHDLQEPVRTISSFANLLATAYKDQLDDKANRYLQYIQQSSDRSQQLIVDLLDYGRIGRHTKPRNVDLNDALNDVLDDLSVKIEETNAKISHAPLPVVKGHPTELRLLLQNLISNAIKFKKADENPQVDISVETEGDRVSVSVKDHGIGIPDKYLDRIFVIFKKLHNRTEYEGTGIGLAHCKKIVELHNGSLNVNSQEGRGSVFTFTIPYSS